MPPPRAGERRPLAEQDTHGSGQARNSDRQRHHKVSRSSVGKAAATCLLPSENSVVCRIRLPGKPDTGNQWHVP